MIRLAIVIVLCSSVGCQTTAPPVLTAAVSESWGNGSAASVLSPDAWVDDLADERLKGFIREGLKRNFDLQARDGRYRQALAAIEQSRAPRRPTVTANSTATRSQRNDPVNGRLPDPRSSQIDSRFSASWELDVWRRLEDGVMAAAADAVATGYDLKAAQLSLATNIAGRYCDAITATRQLALADANEKSFLATLDVVEHRFRAGIAAAADVHLARANVATARSSRQAAKQSLDEARRRMEVLCGRYPEGNISLADTLPTIVPPPAGLPSQLLNRRPDLLAAQHRVDAAFARLRISQKERLPSFTLTGAAGTSTEKLKNIANAHYLFWNIAAGLATPVIDGGRIKAGITASEATLDSDIATYNQLVLNAFREVETALQAESLIRQQVAHLTEAASESAQAEAQSLAQYERGLVPITSVLVAQRRRVDAERSLIQTRNQLVQNRLSLYLALGGAFADDETNENQVVQQ